MSNGNGNGNGAGVPAPGGWQTLSPAELFALINAGVSAIVAGFGQVRSANVHESTITNTRGETMHLDRPVEVRFPVGITLGIGLLLGVAALALFWGMRK